MKGRADCELANTLRVLALDMVERANSGHPGMPLGLADVVMILFRDFLRFNPKDPRWLARDRLVLSAGHGSALLYAALFLSGYNYNIEDLKSFRKMHSKTPGHPEYNLDLGVETTTGPLGQGLANAVGMALGERLLNARFPEFHHKTYAIIGDGCLMEGISYEATSLAGHLNLSNLVVIFDSNGISIDGPVSLAFSEDVKQRFEALNWFVVEMDGHSYSDIRAKLAIASRSNKPTLVIAQTKIGYGSSLHEGRASAHGAAFGEAAVQDVRQNLNYHSQPFVIPEDILNAWRSFSKRNLEEYDEWQKTCYAKLRNVALESKINIDSLLSIKEACAYRAEPESSRKTSGKVLEALTAMNDFIIGGSADLTSSNCTKSSSQKIIMRENFSGSYIHYGVREHAMVAVMSGILLHSYFKSYCGTFLVFSDYCRPAIRLAAMMNLPAIYVMTHDSIALGEDGPTHQPVEHLFSLRSIPNLTVLRPCDAIETVEAWEVALKNESGPTMLVLSRQDLLPLRTATRENAVSNGGYVIQRSNAKHKVNLIATGSEVQLAISVARELEGRDIGAAVISMPSLITFVKQSKSDQESIVTPNKLNVVIEAGLPYGWEGICGPEGLFFGVSGFGASGSREDLYQHFSLTESDIVRSILAQLKKGE